ncbi:hypothetical protein GCM10027517_21540 [Phycicoccus ginsengisoli]
MTVEALALFGAILPLAAAIAISPLPLIAVMLMLASARARRTGWGFLAGWVVGVGALAAIASLVLGTLQADGRTEPRRGVAVVSLVIGLGLLAVAAKQALGIRRVDRGAALPAWMHGVDRLDSRSAALLGLSLSTLSPKNIVLALSAGSFIGANSTTPSAQAVALLGFTAVAALSVVVPVVATTCAGARVAPALGRTREWLTRRSTTILSVLLAAIGLVLVGQGLGAL